MLRLIPESEREANALAEAERLLKELNEVADVIQPDCDRLSISEFLKARANVDLLGTFAEATTNAH